MGESSLYDDRVSAFRVEYRKSETQRQFMDLVTHTIKKCEELLESINIKGVVQGRTKKCNSLDKKLITLMHDHNTTPDFMGWVVEGQDIYKHPEMGDLAGVRIGLYFPDDVSKVAQEIEKHFDKKHLFGTVTGGRIATQSGNLDPQKHSIGQWYSPGPNGTDEYWEHYGYKSWQVVVEWREPLPERFKSLRAEIQVGTVVAQAWAEVQHNIIYKRPHDILTTPTMMRMSDAINGMAITTELMLKELKRSLEEETEKRDRHPFRDGAEFLNWFQSTYLDLMQPAERQRWASNPNITKAYELVQICNERRSWGIDHTVPVPCRIEFKKLIDQRLRVKTDKDWDISEMLIRALKVEWVKVRLHGSANNARGQAEKDYWTKGRKN